MSAPAGRKPPARSIPTRASTAQGGSAPQDCNGSSAVQPNAHEALVAFAEELADLFVDVYLARRSAKVRKVDENNEGDQ
jgi:hypothetical protein